MAKKGQRFKMRSAEEKYEIIKPILESEKSSKQIMRETGIDNGLITRWVHRYLETGMEGLRNKKKPGNPLSKYIHKRKLTEMERLEYENMKLRIENERLKKGYLVKGDGTIVIVDEEKFWNSK